MNIVGLTQHWLICGWVHLVKPLLLLEDTLPEVRKAIQILRYRAPGFVYSIGMPPSAAAAALEAFKLAKTELWRIKQLRERTELFKALCEKAGVDILNSRHSASAVIPVMCGSTERCIEIMKRLREIVFW